MMAGLNVGSNVKGGGQEAGTLSFHDVNQSANGLVVRMRFRTHCKILTGYLE